MRTPSNTCHISSTRNPWHPCPTLQHPQLCRWQVTYPSLPTPVIIASTCVSLPAHLFPHLPRLPHNRGAITCLLPSPACYYPSLTTPATPYHARYTCPLLITPASSWHVTCQHNTCPFIPTIPHPCMATPCNPSHTCTPLPTFH